MSIQDNIHEVKEKLESDEKMLASAFKLEKFYKKYKLLILGTAGAIVLFFGGRAVMNVIEENRLASANESYLILSKDASNKEALATLKDKNPKLLELFEYKSAMENNNTEVLKRLSSSKNSLVADVAGYHLAILNGSEATSNLYSELAILNNADIMIKDGKVSEGSEELSMIEEKSPLYNLSKIMKHYGIKGQ